MLIGIDASRAFLKQRTGIEEYAYQTIRHLRTALPETDIVVLYVRKRFVMRGLGIIAEYPKIDFPLPAHWHVRGIWAPRFWTQVGLSLEMFVHTPDVLFVPAHTIPIVHPKRSIVTIHGLEYEFCKEAYSLWERLYMRFSIRYSCKAASTVVCVSENTKHDVMRLYGTSEARIRVVHEGYSHNDVMPDMDHRLQKIAKKPYMLFVGRLEERKNIIRIIEAFEILKEKYRIPHKLVLAGKPGYGYQRIQNQKCLMKNRNDIIEPGYISEEEKWQLLQGADVFLFPTLYEGFGIPVLEAQSVGTPVVTSETSSLPEVGGEGAVYVDPLDTESIAEGIQQLLSDKAFRDGIIEKAAHNVNRFSWAQCAEEISQAIQQPRP
jgi:glycosyltransferase involved in cell wall biosynthesis